MRIEIQVKYLASEYYHLIDVQRLTLALRTYAASLDY